MKKNFFLFMVSVLSFFALTFSFEIQNEKVLNNQIEHSLKYNIKSSIKYALFKENEVFYIETEKFEEKFENVFVKYIRSKELQFYSVLIGYYRVNDLCKGVSICLNYKKRIQQKQIKLSYLMDQYMSVISF